MKIRTTTKLLLSVIFLSLFSNLKMSGQTAIQAKEAYIKEHADDAKYIKGFDEQAVISELKKKGIRESEYKGIVRGRKSQYIAKQKGVAKREA